MTATKTEGLPSTTPLEVDESCVVRTRYLELDYVPPYEVAADKSDRDGVLSSSPGMRGITPRLKKAVRLMYTILRSKILSFDRAGWYPYAVKKGLQLLDEDRAKVIFSSSPPFVSHLIASYLHRKTGIPWVAEFRSPWAHNHSTRKRQPFCLMEEQIEKRIMRDSSRLVTLSEPWAKDMEALHSKRVTVIHNGFDEMDYDGAVPLYPKFTITYTGTVYHGKQDPTPLFEAVTDLRKDGKLHLRILRSDFWR